jgi:Zn-dependent M28 family amino/carboxypeptidase
MKGALVAAVASLIVAASAAVATQTSHRIGADELMRVVRELASDRYAGRRTGTEGGRAARAWVRAAFADIGLAPAGTASYDQSFQFTRRNTRYDDAANLVGRVAGTDPRAKAIVITAHYDHVGVQDGRLYHGADDNASGVGALLAIARYIKAHPLRHTAVFAALDAEELGLEGAKAFINRPIVPASQVAIDVNLDMVSRSDRNEIFAAGTYQSPWLVPILEDVRRRSAVTLLFGHDRPGNGALDDWTMQSDHGAFHQAGVPFVYFGVEDHSDYHKPTDTADKIDAAFYRNVVEMVLDAVLALDAKLD